MTAAYAEETDESGPSHVAEEPHDGSPDDDDDYDYDDDYDDAYDDVDADGVERPVFESMTRGRPIDQAGRATTEVDRETMERRHPRSTPDALRYEPGVFVQQTAQSQGSPYIRGRTGQHTVLRFDGVRMNNALFRQGPNQYFFTIDSRTVDRIDVTRGSASTLYGSDAIAGAIEASPIEPRLDPEHVGLALRPRLSGRYSSADQERGGRAQIDGQVGSRFGWIGGVGYRVSDQLRSGGPVFSPRDGSIPEVPRFAADGKTQLGTGFREMTGDLRLVYRIRNDLRATMAYYDYRQRDAPRTDLCPPAYAPFNECLVYDEQDRTLVYGSLEGRLTDWARGARVTLSYQRQHERRSQDRPASFVIGGGRDDVHALGLLGSARTGFFAVNEHTRWRLHYGVDGTHDRVSSVAWTEFTDVDIVRFRSRGQYIDGSTYTQGGAFSEAEFQIRRRFVVRAGGRLAFAAARASADEESGTLAVRQGWVAPVGGVGAEYWANRWLTLTLSADEGFRAPNLDDLTSRQQTGPGFQIENAALAPERALTIEAGFRARVHPHLRVDAWVYHATLRNAIARSGRGVADCPPNTPQCGASWSRFQLINLPGVARVTGVEGAVEATWSPWWTTRVMASWAHGDGPNPELGRGDERAPLSRVPPLNGSVESTYRHSGGFYGGAALRWALAQDRLASSDIADERIPVGGTPGFASLDLRAGMRFGEAILFSAVLENLTDTAYRYHGSSVNGPGRSVSLQLDVGW